MFKSFIEKFTKGSLRRISQRSAQIRTLRYLSRLPALKSQAGATIESRALIFTGVTLNNTHVRTEILFSEVLSEAGYKTSVFYCAGLFTTCEFANPKNDDLHVGRDCGGCRKFATELIGSSPSTGALRGLSSIELSASQKETLDTFLEIYEKAPINDLLKINISNVDLHEHVMSTYSRQTLTGPANILDIEEKRYRLIGQNVVRAVVYISAILDQHLPTLVICTHGIYLNHGPLTDLCRSKGISVTVWGVPFRKGTFFFTKGDTYHRALHPNLNKTDWNMPLTKLEEQRAVKYIVSKESSGRDYWSYSGTLKSDTERHIVDLASSKRVTILFTNVDWDAQIYYDGNIFESQMEWIDHTLALFGNQDNQHLVIRVHPAEADIMKSRSSLVNLIKAKIRMHAATNVTLVEPSDGCSSYSLMKLAYCALIYGSKISLECAYRNIPTIIVGNSMFRHTEFSYLPRSKSDYDALLCNEITPIVGQVESATRFAHYLYFRVIQECKWAADLLDVNTEFHDLTEVQRQELADALVHGTA
jgi:hypothetical protein